MGNAKSKPYIEPPNNPIIISELVKINNDLLKQINECNNARRLSQKSDGLSECHYKSIIQSHPNQFVEILSSMHKDKIECSIKTVMMEQVDVIYKQNELNVFIT